MQDLSIINNYNLKETVNYILENFHHSIKEDLENIKVLLDKIWNKQKYKEDFSLPREVFKQLINELINHLSREKNEFFPEIINLETWNFSKNATPENYSKIKGFLRLQKSEHRELVSYLDWWKNLLSKLNFKWDEDFLFFKKIAEKIYKNILDTVFIEDNYLNKKVEKYCEELNCKV